MSKDTTNALTDFDLAVAVSERALNDRLRWAWKTWKASPGSKFDDTIKIFLTRDKNGQFIPSKTGISAALDPISVKLDVPGALQGQVEVMLTLKSGSVTYYDEELEERTTTPIKNWQVSFLTDIKKRPVTREELHRIDERAHVAASTTIDKSGLGDAAFSIEFLFLRFTQIDLILTGNSRIGIPPDVPSSARTKALDALSMMLDRQIGEFVLGTVLRRVKKEAKPTFALTGMVLDVRRNTVAPGASTLVHLGMFEGRALPADLDGARAKFVDQWVRPEMLDGTERTVSGTMAISKRMLLDTWLMPMIQAATAPTYTQHHALEWHLKWQGRAIDEQQSRKYFVKKTRDTSWHLKYTALPGTPRIAFEGFVEGDCRVEASNGGIVSGNVSVVGRRNITGTIKFVAEGAGASFALFPELTTQVGDPVITSNKSEGIVILAKAEPFVDALIKSMGLDLPNDEIVSNMVRESVAKLTTDLEKRLSGVVAGLKDDLFIPPGGGVYAMARPRFSTAGDMLLDIIYQLS